LENWHNESLKKFSQGKMKMGDEVAVEEDDAGRTIGSQKTATLCTEELYLST
jgi:hypothetical protein